MRQCNRCDRPVAQRVEAFMPSQRLVVCARCAIALVEREGATIRPHLPPQQSLFVAADGWYSPRTADVTAHQRTLDEQARRYAERVARVIARRGATEIAA